MLKLKQSITSLAAAAIISLALPAISSTASACELNRPVKLADGDWQAIQVLNSIAQIVLKSGYDCDSELVSAAMVPLFTALGKSDVDIFMDVWISNNQEIWDKTKAQGAVDLGVLYPDATEGWYVPRYLIAGDAARGIAAAAPDLKTVADLPKYKLLFSDPEQPEMGRFMNCPIGWGCEQTNDRKIAAYGLAGDFVNFKPGSGAALDAAFASAYKRGKPVLGYYWAPTWLLGQFDMVKLEEPACNDGNASACSFPLTPAHTTASAVFVKDAAELKEFFENFKTTSAQVSQMLAYLQENAGSTREDAAKHFLKTQEAEWTTWVSADVAAKIKAGL